ncbi:E3 ubiquitin-protein ligase LRSAM1-like isoform X2 [Cloeon dipterum]|uniref:E3 ubiquitin-protein ligase LRSAM1-like isoform X2 n=1 Tax=Cloeon dipterum TaxID=197152 RepID=UPI00321FC6A5
MPLFFKTKKTTTTESDDGVNYKSRLEKKLCLAKEDPEPIFDLSECNLKSVTSGTYVLCKVLRKTSLILRNNLLSNLSGGGALSDLSLLEILDLSRNKLQCLPEEIRYLKNLRILNASHNQLSQLPQSLAQLAKLEDLNLSNNCLSHVPDFVGILPLLQNFDISSNPLKDSQHLKDKKSIAVEKATETKKAAVLPLETMKRQQVPKNFVDEQSESEKLRVLLESRQRQQQELLLRLNTFDKDQQDALDKVLERQRGQLKTVLTAAQNEGEEERRRVRELKAQEEARSCRLAEDIMLGERLERSVLERLLQQEEERNRSLTRELAQEEELERARLADLLASVSARHAPLIALVLDDQSLQKSILASLRDRALCQEHNLSQCVVDELRLQQAALMALKEKGDSKSRLIADEMAQIQQQLGYLSALEIKRKKGESEETLGEIALERSKLSAALGNLLQKQQKRRNELIDEIMHQYDGMDEKLWMIHLERLLLNVPENIDVSVAKKEKKAATPPTENPSAPDGEDEAQNPTAPTLEECVICMDKQCEEVFLPCGHICACSACTALIMICPLCRADIEQHLTLSWSNRL